MIIIILSLCNNKEIIYINLSKKKYFINEYKKEKEVNILKFSDS